MRYIQDRKRFLYVYAIILEHFCIKVMNKSEINGLFLRQLEKNAKLLFGR